MSLTFHKVAALPGTLVADAFYLVENGNYAETYVTDDAGVAKMVGNSVMTNALIAEALANWSGAGNMVEIVADIAARDTLIATLDHNAMILVIDATGDPTVNSGSALYAYDDTAAEVYKIAEYESMDVVIQWAAIQGGPTSTPAQIDDAVSKAHSHTNKTVLDDLTDNGSGGLLYKGVAVTTDWTTRNW